MAQTNKTLGSSMVVLARVDEYAICCNKEVIEGNLRRYAQVLEYSGDEELVVPLERIRGVITISGQSRTHSRWEGVVRAENGTALTLSDGHKVVAFTDAFLWGNGWRGNLILTRHKGERGNPHLPPL